MDVYPRLALVAADDEARAEGGQAFAQMAQVQSDRAPGGGGYAFRRRDQAFSAEALIIAGACGAYRHAFVAAVHGGRRDAEIAGVEVVRHAFEHVDETLRAGVDDIGGA